MQVLILNPVPPEGKKVYTGYNHGIGYLSAVAKRAGHQTALLTFSGSDQGLAATVARARPDVIALTATSAQWPLAAWAAGRLTEALPEVPIVAGGVHSTVATEDVISTPGIWAACRGEGEQSFVAFLSGLEFGGWEETPGFWARPQAAPGIPPTPILPDNKAAAGEVVKNEAATTVDITTLPHPDRLIYDYQAILDAGRANVGAEFMASRGCPYDCSYCVNPVLSEITGGAWKNVRYRRVSDVIDEIESVLAQYNGINIIGFHDDIFGLDKRWLTDFAEEYRRRISVPFWCNQRAGTFDDDDVAMLAEAGCFRVHVGIECADERLRREVLGRDISSEEIEEAFGMLKRRGIKTVAFNMIGIPYETEETLKSTIALNRRIRPDWMLVSIFSPFPGTCLADVARREGWLSGDLPESYYDADWALDQPSLSREKLLYYYENFVPMVLEGG